MRIVGGEKRGVPLEAPKGDRTRPTSDRLRESVFNILAHNFAGEFEDARVLDLFAGTGALGLEAVSRGAAFALFVEMAAEARGILRRNIDTVGAVGRTRVWRRDATRLGACPIARFTLVFADPPYGKGLGEAGLIAAHRGGWTTPAALAVLEEKAGALPEQIPGWTPLDQRTIGESSVGFYRAGSPPDG